MSRIPAPILVAAEETQQNEAQEHEGPVYKNMQHALVEMIHQLGANSPYHDGSVRMKELFSNVETCSIETNGQIDSGPHRFSIFNSSLCGRRSAAEIFERIDDQDRSGSWWKLKVPYERALELALAQKGITKMKQRARTKSDKNSQRKDGKYSLDYFIWSKSNVLEPIDNIQRFVQMTAKLREENKEMEEKSYQLADEISQLKQSCQPEVNLMMEMFLNAHEQIKILRERILNAQKQIKSLNEQTIALQD